MIYFATGDEAYPGMDAISGDEWEHDSGNESDSSLPIVFVGMRTTDMFNKIIGFSNVEFQTFYKL